MKEQGIKAKLKNSILVTMMQHVGKDVLEILDKAMTDLFVNINMEEITTLPAEVQNSVDEQNKYIIQLFLYKKRELRDGTKEGYLNAIKRLLLQVEKPLTLVDDIDICYYLNCYEKRNIHTTGKMNQNTTVNNERRYLSAFFTWMRIEKLRPDNPVESTAKRKEIRKPIDYFKKEEMAALCDYCQTKRERALIEVLRSTGARVGEVISVTRDMIDWATGDIIIMGEKGNRFRPIYLDEDARYHLKKYIDSREDDSPYLFVHEKATHEQLQDCGIRNILKRIAKRAKLKCRVYPHKMRKTLGMRLKNSGVDIGTIQEVLGHATPAVTAIYYAQSTPETLRGVRMRCAG